MKTLSKTASMLALCAAPTVALPDCLDDAMLVFDGSLSMLETGFDVNGRPKIEEGRAAVAVVAPEAAENRRLGLVTYGPGSPTDCYGVTLHFPPIENAAPALTGVINAMEPDGSTALTDAVNLAAEALMPLGGSVVLVTDGQETCGGDPCGLARDLAALGNTRVHVIGFKVRGAFFEWQSVDPNDFFATEPAARCLADETGGEYVGAETLDQLIAALRQTLGCPLFS